MAVGPYSWSTTASSNGDASSAVNFAEGQSPASLNNAARALMAEIAGWLKSVGGSATYGGSSSDYTITNPAVAAWSAYAAGQIIALKANHTNDDTTVNVNVDSLGNKRVKTLAGADPAVGEIVSGGIYLLAYDGTNFQLLGSGGNFQPLDADLTAIAALGYTSGTYIISKTAADTWALNSISANGLSLVGGADYAAMRTLLSLGTAALKNTGTSGDAVGLLNAANTWSATQTFENGAQHPIVARRDASSGAVGYDFQLKDSAGNYTPYGRFIVVVGDSTDTSEDGELRAQIIVNGTITTQLTLTGASATFVNPVLVPAGSASAPSIAGSGDSNTGFEFAGSDVIHGVAGGTRRTTLTTAALSPASNDGLTLGTASLGWADQHVATGFTLNAANGNAVITHSSGRFDVTTGDFGINASPSAQAVNSAGFRGFGEKRSKTADFTFALSDNGQLVQQNSASSEVALIPTNASVTFPIGNTAIPVENIGAGTMVLTPDTGVTLYDETGASGSITLSQHDGGVLYKTDTNTWRYRGSHD